jgi:hypothetical protein
MTGKPNYYVEADEQGGRVSIEFPSGMAFNRRSEISQFLLAYFESVTTESAVKAGLAPIGAGNRKIEHNRIKRP